MAAWWPCWTSWLCLSLLRMSSCSCSPAGAPACSPSCMWACCGCIPMFWPAGPAFFYITLKDSSSSGSSSSNSIDDICVYAVGSDCWPADKEIYKIKTSAIVRGSLSVKAALLPRNTTPATSSSTGRADEYLGTLRSDEDSYGAAVCAQGNVIGQRIASLLNEAVKGVSVDGNAAGIQVSCIPGFRTQYSHVCVPLWVLHW